MRKDATPQVGCSHSQKCQCPPKQTQSDFYSPVLKKQLTRFSNKCHHLRDIVFYPHRLNGRSHGNVYGRRCIPNCLKRWTIKVRPPPWRHQEKIGSRSNHWIPTRYSDCLSVALSWSKYYFAIAFVGINTGQLQCYHILGQCAQPSSNCSFPNYQ